MPPIRVGFWAKSSLNKGPFCDRFTLNVVGPFGRNLQNSQKRGTSQLKSKESEYTGHFW